MTVSDAFDRPSGTRNISYAIRLPSSKLLGHYRTPLRGESLIAVMNHNHYKTLRYGSYSRFTTIGFSFSPGLIITWGSEASVRATSAAVADAGNWSRQARSKRNSITP